jgi:hypothetical protein
MGAAGDMLTGALLELTDDPEETLKELNSLGIPGVVYEMETSEKCGIRGTRIHVLVNGEEEDHHTHHHPVQIIPVQAGAVPGGLPGKPERFCRSSLAFFSYCAFLSSRYPHRLLPQPACLR